MYRRFALPLFLLVFAVFCSAVFLLGRARGHHTLSVAFLDVGQGDSIYVESPTGAQMLIDGGPPSGGVVGKLGEVLSPFDHSLDAIVATHPDSDHISGLSDVFERFRVGVFLDAPISGKTGLFVDRLKAAVAKDHTPEVVAKRGMVLDLGGGAYARVLYPDRDLSSLPVKQDNDASVVTQVVYGKTKAVFMGDITSAVEPHLVSLEGTKLQSNLLKVGHHGSKYSSSMAFLRAVHPSVAIISVGAGNRYGHPATSTLEHLAAVGTVVHRTDREGTVVFQSDGAVFREIATKK